MENKLSVEERIHDLKQIYDSGQAKQISIDGYCYVIERIAWPFINLRRAFFEPGSKPEERRIMKAGEKFQISGIKFKVMSATGRAYFRIAPVNSKAFK